MNISPIVNSVKHNRKKTTIGIVVEHTHKTLQECWRAGERPIVAVMLEYSSLALRIPNCGLCKAGEDEGIE